MRSGQVVIGPCEYRGLRLNVKGRDFETTVSLSQAFQPAEFKTNRKLQVNRPSSRPSILERTPVESPGTSCEITNQFRSTHSWSEPTTNFVRLSRLLQMAIMS